MAHLLAKKLAPEEIQNIVDAKTNWIVKETEPIAVFLFGSAHTLTMSAASDVDLLVVYSDNTSLSEKKAALALSRPPDDWPHDLLMYHETDFKIKAKRMGSICHEAIRYGRVVYGGINNDPF